VVNKNVRLYLHLQKRHIRVEGQHGVDRIGYDRCHATGISENRQPGYQAQGAPIPMLPVMTPLKKVLEKRYQNKRLHTAMRGKVGKIGSA
jgi:hypothetical protein